MPAYTDWGTQPPSLIEQIARTRLLEKARKDLGLPATLPESAAIDAAIIEALALPSVGLPVVADEAARLSRFGATPIADQLAIVHLLGYLTRFDTTANTWLPEGLTRAAGPVVCTQSQKLVADGVADDAPTLAAADALCVASGGRHETDTLAATQTRITIGSNLTLNAHWRPQHLNGKVWVAANKTLTIAGDFDPSRYARIFDHTMPGTVVFTKAAQFKASTFNVKCDGVTDDTAALIFAEKTLRGRPYVLEFPSHDGMVISNTVGPIGTQAATWIGEACTLPDGHASKFIWNGPKGLILTDVLVSNNSASISSATGGFTQALVGQRVLIEMTIGGGVTGLFDQGLSATVQSVTNGNTLVLDTVWTGNTIAGCLGWIGGIMVAARSCDHAGIVGLACDMDANWPTTQANIAFVTDENGINGITGTQCRFHFNQVHTNPFNRRDFIGFGVALVCGNNQEYHDFSFNSVYGSGQVQLGNVTVIGARTVVVSNSMAVTPTMIGQYLSLESAGPVVNGEPTAAVSTIAALVTVSGGGAAGGATSLPVNAIDALIPSGTVINFTSTKTATLTANALAGATSLTVAALGAAIAGGDTGVAAGRFLASVAPTTAVFPAWSGATAYLPSDIVSNGGINYMCLKANTNQAPPNGTYWVQQRAQGDRCYGYRLYIGSSANAKHMYSHFNNGVNCYRDIFQRNGSFSSFKDQPAGSECDFEILNSSEPINIWAGNSESSGQRLRYSAGQPVNHFGWRSDNSRSRPNIGWYKTQGAVLNLIGSELGIPAGAAKIFDTFGGSIGDINDIGGRYFGCSMWQMGFWDKNGRPIKSFRIISVGSQQLISDAPSSLMLINCTQNTSAYDVVGALLAEVRTNGATLSAHTAAVVRAILGSAHNTFDNLIALKTTLANDAGVNWQNGSNECHRAEFPTCEPNGFSPAFIGTRVTPVNAASGSPTCVAHQVDDLRANPTHLGATMGYNQLGTGDPNLFNGLTTFGTGRIEKATVYIDIGAGGNATPNPAGALHYRYRLAGAGTVNNPLNPADGMEFEMEIFNNSAAPVTPTLGAEFLGTGYGSIGIGKSRTRRWIRDGALSKWKPVGAVSEDF